MPHISMRLLLIFCLLAGFAQTSVAFSPENAVWEVFSNRSDILALALSQDKRTLWVGANGGLERRDARSGQLLRAFISDSLSDKHGIFQTSAMALHTETDGGLWAGTSNGLAHRAADGAWARYNTGNSGLPTNIISSLCADGNGGLWVGTYRGLAHRAADGAWTMHDIGNSGLSNIGILTLYSDGSGTLWVGTYSGIVHRAPDGVWTVYDTGNSGLPDNQIHTLHFDDAGGLWAGTDSGGLAHRTVSGIWTVYNTGNSDLPDNRVNALHIDAGGALWAGTRGGLARRTTDGAWTAFGNGSPSTDWISALHTDGHGGLWVGTTGAFPGGLAHRSHDGAWTVHNTDNGSLPGHYSDANVLLADDSGGLWVGGGYGGLAHRTAHGAWSVYNVDNSGLPGNFVSSLQIDASGGLWVGTSYNGLAYRAFDGVWTAYTAETGGMASVSALYAEDGGGLWAAGIPYSEYGDYNDAVVPPQIYGGLAYRAVDGAWTLYDSGNSGLPYDSVSALHPDGRGGLWVGAHGDGLAHYADDGVWTVVDPVDSGYFIRALHTDGADLWVGSYRSLRRRADDGVWTVYNTYSPYDRVSALHTCVCGGLWVGTSGSGLAHRATDDTWTVYNTDNSGLPDNTVRSLDADDSDGLWVGTSAGLARLTVGGRGCGSADIASDLLLPPEKRAAILIHPRGPDSGYNQAVSIEFMAAYAYRTLHTRGYNNDEIYFLSHTPEIDFNADGLADKNIVDSPVTFAAAASGAARRDLTRADVQQAFDWAKQKGKMEQALTVIFVGRGAPATLLLDPFGETLTALELKEMLDDYQQNTGNTVAVILEAGHAGSLPLSAPNRLIVTSSGEDLAYYGNNGYLSFSRLYFDALRRGDSFYAAFTQVSRNLRNFGGPFVHQTPQLDDPDGFFAQSLCLNGCFGSLCGEPFLEVETQPGTATADLPLSVRIGFGADRIARVWAAVMTPEAGSRRNEQGFSTEPAPVVNLRKSPDDDSRWQGVFSGFHSQGDYVLTFMAEDNDGVIITAAPLTLTGEVPETLISSSALYRNGETLRVTLPPLPASQEQYLGIGLPDNGPIYLLSDLNRFLPFDGFNLSSWQGGDTAIEWPVSTDMQAGEYSLYLLRIPAGLEPSAYPEQWRLGVSRFKVR